MNLPAAIARLGPWLVALAPAWFVYDSLVTQLDVPGYIAMPIAAGVELTGVASFGTALHLQAWNRDKRKTDPTAPVLLALLPVGVYLVSGVVLNAVLKQNPVLALFFVLAAAGYGTIAIQTDQSRRETEAKQAKIERRKNRQAALERSLNKERPPDKERPNKRSPEFDELLATVRELSKYSDVSEFNQADVQEWIGKKRTTAYAVLRYGEKMGVIQRVGRGKFISVDGRKNEILS